MKDKLAILKWYDTRELPQVDYDNVDKDFAKAIYEGTAFKKESRYTKESSFPRYKFLVRFDDNGNFFGFRDAFDCSWYLYSCVGKKLKDGRMAVLIFNRLSYDPEAYGCLDIFKSQPDPDYDSPSFFERLRNRKKRKTLGVPRQFHIIVTDESGLQIYGTNDSWEWQRYHGRPTYFELNSIREEFADYNPCRGYHNLCDNECRGHNPTCKACSRPCKECTRDDCANCGTEWIKCKCPEDCDQFVSFSEFEAEQLEKISVRIVEHFDDLLSEQKDLVRRASALIDDELRKIKL